jgi:uncharacterized hydrophobic protein (TIGR00271 family)
VPRKLVSIESGDAIAMMNPLTNFFSVNAFQAADIDAFRSKLFFDGPARRQYLVRFWTLTFLSTVIASYGIINNAPATVIGAMIIAPLMTPMMATAAALVMGDTRQDIQGLLLVAGGVALVLLVSTMIGLLHNLTHILSIEQNGQLYSRISPQSTDLLIALACGTAGAFAISRDDIADSLPGVAISISLVPPLCVCGICLSMGQWSAAWGALLLFLTNFLSIVLAGGGVFMLLRLHKVTRESMGIEARRHAFTAVTAGIIMVSVPLAMASVQIARESLTEYRTTEAANDWLQGSDYSVQQVDSVQGKVYLWIAGTGETPELNELQSTLMKKVERKLEIDLRVTPIARTRFQINER